VDRKQATDGGSARGQNKCKMGVVLAITKNVVYALLWVRGLAVRGFSRGWSSGSKQGGFVASFSREPRGQAEGRRGQEEGTPPNPQAPSSPAPPGGK
jgi:hypothetical protein